MEHMLSGEERRERIISLLEESSWPKSGTELARILGVSRQVIVQDIALLRATNKNILSTNKGYILFEPQQESAKCKETFCVRHSAQEVQDEFYTIVDLGGKVLDVVIEHDLYGQIAVDLIIANRQDTQEFYHKMMNSPVRLLKELTQGIHYHTVVAKDRESMERIRQALLEKGYLLLDS